MTNYLKSEWSRSSGMNTEAEIETAYGILLMTDSSEVAESSYVALRLIGHDVRCCFNDDIDPICYSIWVGAEHHQEAIEHITNIFSMYLDTATDETDKKELALSLWNEMMTEHGFGILMESLATCTQDEWMEAAIASAEFPINEDMS